MRPLTLLCALAILIALVAQRQREPEKDFLHDRPGLSGQAYSVLIRELVSEENKKLYIIEQTDRGAVPTLEARLADGLPGDSARAGLAHQRRKYFRAMAQVCPQTELYPRRLRASKPNHS